MDVSNINDSRVWQRVIDRLIEMTSRGSLEWEDWTEKLSRSTAISPLFVAFYKHWHILIYRARERSYYDEDAYTMQDDVVMEVINPSRSMKWTLPKVPSRYRLIDLIEYKQANVESLVEDLLRE